MKNEEEEKKEAQTPLSATVKNWVNTTMVNYMRRKERLLLRTKGGGMKW